MILTLSPGPGGCRHASANMELVANPLGIGMVYVGYFVALVAQSPRLRQWIGLRNRTGSSPVWSMAILPSGICAASPQTLAGSLALNSRPVPARRAAAGLFDGMRKTGVFFRGIFVTLNLALCRKNVVKCNC